MLAAFSKPRHLFLVPANDRAYIHIKQPKGIWIPDFGYGPITGRLNKPTSEDVPFKNGDYARFPSLPRSKRTYERKIIEAPSMERKYFDNIAAAVPADEENIFELMRCPGFFAAMTSIFREADMRIGALGTFQLANIAQPVESLA